MIGFAAVGLLAVIGFAVVAVIAVLAFVVAKRRREALQAEAARRGWRYRIDDDGWARGFSAFPFGTGDRQRASDLIDGVVGGERFLTFALQIEDDRTDSSGKRTTDRDYYQVTCVPLATVLPRLAFTPDNAFLRALGRLGLRDVDVESHDFNQRWRVVADDDAYAHAVLAPSTIDALLAAPHDMKVVFVESGHLVAVSAGARSTLAWVDGYVATLARIRAAIPGFVHADYGRARS